MGKIILSYPSDYKLNQKIKIYFNDDFILDIEMGKEIEIKVPEDGILLLKGGTRKTKVEVKKNKDYSISISWDSESGSLIADAEIITENETDNKNENKKQPASNNKEEIENTIDGVPIIGSLLSIGGVIVGFLGFIITVLGIIPLGMIMIFGGCFLTAIGKELMNHIPINKLFSKGDIVGKSLEYIESIIGKHTSVDVSNNNARVYKWEDRLEIICDKNNICKEVLKKD